MELFAIFLINIQKTLRLKKKINLKEFFSKFYQDKDYFNLFTKTDNKRLFLLKEPRINHKIKLKKVNRKDIEVSWSSLYNISREEFLILKKELTKLLNKGFIKVNKSAVKIPVLFIYKPGKKLWFYVNYKTLNKIIRKDCYFLSLIQKILYQLNKVK